MPRGGGNPTPQNRNFPPSHPNTEGQVPVNLSSTQYFPFFSPPELRLGPISPPGGRKKALERASSAPGSGSWEVLLRK